MYLRALRHCDLAFAICCRQEARTSWVMRLRLLLTLFWSLCTNRLNVLSRFANSVLPLHGCGVRWLGCFGFGVGFASCAVFAKAALAFLRLSEVRLFLLTLSSSTDVGW